MRSWSVPRSAPKEREQGPAIKKGQRDIKPKGHTDARWVVAFRSSSRRWRRRGDAGFASVNAGIDVIGAGRRRYDAGYQRESRRSGVITDVVITVNITIVAVVAIVITEVGRIVGGVDVVG